MLAFGRCYNAAHSIVLVVNLKWRFFAVDAGGVSREESMCMLIEPNRGLLPSSSCRQTLFHQPICSPTVRHVCGHDSSPQKRKPCSDRWQVRRSITLVERDRPNTRARVNPHALPFVNLGGNNEFRPSSASAFGLASVGRLARLIVRCGYSSRHP